MSIHKSVEVLMSDSARREARKLRVGDMIMGLDKEGLIVPAEILSISETPSKPTWWNLRTKRHETRQGSYFNSVDLSLTQEVLLGPTGLSKPVSEIESGELVQGTTSTLNLDLVQKSILMGILLGDGSIQYGKTESASYALRWSHSTKQLEYLKWTVDALGSIANVGYSETSGYGSTMHTARTSHHPDLSDLFEGFDKRNGVIPPEVSNYMNPISLAFWYMDDGSLTHNPNQQDRATFSTYSFSDESIENLRSAPLKLGLPSVVQQERKGRTIRLNREAARAMFIMIAPLIPPSMQYKLPIDLRGGPGWMPKPTLLPGYRNALLEVLQKEPRMVNPFGARMNLTGLGVDLTTSTGNFYAAGLLLKA